MRASSPAQANMLTCVAPPADSPAPPVALEPPGPPDGSAGDWSSGSGDGSEPSDTDHRSLVY